LLLQQGCRYPHRRERRGLSHGSGIVREITAEELEYAFRTNAFGDFYFTQVGRVCSFSRDAFAACGGAPHLPIAVPARILPVARLQKETRDLPSTESNHCKKQFVGYKASHCVVSRKGPTKYYELDFNECSMKASHNGLRRRRLICAASVSGQPAARLFQEINTRSQSFLDLQSRASAHVSEIEGGAW
jgi:hypothetical protein